MRVLLNAVAAKMGGAANYIQTLARELANVEGHEFLFFVPAGQARAMESLAPHIRVITTSVGDLPFSRRLWFDQVELPEIIRREQVDVLFSTANFATFFCPCRQVLLVRNSLYFSPLYREKILPHKSWTTRMAEALRRSLVCRSIRVSDVVLTPSASLREEISRTVNVPAALVSHYGVDRMRFSGRRRLQCHNGFATLSLTCLYAEHKNVGTLFRALLRLEGRGKKFRLVTTADPSWEGLDNSIRKHDYRLASELQRSGLLELVGPLGGPSLDDVYKTSDIFVYPSITESFGHPLLEAMASGLPIVAADVPVNRELCGSAALYFCPFDAADCADQIHRLMEDPGLRRALAENAENQVRNFSWSEHIRNLLGVLTQNPAFEPYENARIAARAQA